MNFPTVIATITVLFLALTSVFAYYADAANEKKQLIIKDAIKNYSDYGKAETDYKDIYTPLKLFDGKTPSVNVTNTFWSRYDDSGFLINLNSALVSPVCSVKLEVFNPQNTPFVFEIGGKTFNGALDSNEKIINIEGCIKDVDKFAFNFDANSKWTTLSEVKLFTEEKIPPIEPPVCPPGSYWDVDLKKCVQINNPINGTIITNSTITIGVSDSSIVINADDSSNVTTNSPQPKIEEIQPLNEKEDDDDNNKEDEN